MLMLSLFNSISVSPVVLVVMVLNGRVLLSGTNLVWY